MGEPRQPLQPRVRFEVFKRDKFTCQYCGEKAPNVILNCDHVHPAALGGTNDLTNLITSCRKYNGGKGAIAMSDAPAVNKQHETLAELQERRQQIEMMMMMWRDEPQSLSADTVDMIAERITRGDWTPSESGKSEIRKWMKRFSVAEILRAADAAFDIYHEFDNHKITGEN
jgi:HNH endonuclease